MTRDADVYIIEDDDAVRKSLSLLLEANRLRTATFKSAEEFLQLESADQASCLVVDVRLPGMSGIELLEKMAVAQKLIPAVLITGHGDRGIAEQIRDRGKVWFLEKPCDPTRFLTLVAAAVKRDVAS